MVAIAANGRRFSSRLLAGSELSCRPLAAGRAELDVELGLVQEKVRQVCGEDLNVPNALLEADVTLRAFLQQLQVKIRLRTCRKPLTEGLGAAASNPALVT